MERRAERNLDEVIQKAYELFEGSSREDREAFIEGAREYAEKLSYLDDKENLKQLGSEWREQLRSYELARFKTWGGVYMASMNANKNQIIVNSGLARQTVYDVLNRKHM